MGGLLYKNFYYLKIEIIVLAVLQLICSVSVFFVSSAALGGDEAAMQDSMMIIMIVYFCSFYLATLFDMGLFAADEKRISTCFIISTPKGAKSHIQSKYYTLLILNLAVLFCCMITDTISCVLADSILLSCANFLVLFFSGNMILTAFGVPFTIRFGSANGGNIKVATAGVIILIAAIYFLFGDISMFMVEDPVAEIMKWLESGDVLLILSLIPYIAVVLYYISYRISLALYLKGAENYD